MESSRLPHIRHEPLTQEKWDRLQERIRGANVAREALGLALDDVADSPDALAGFWQAVAHTAPQPPKQAPPGSSMDRAEAEAFEETLCLTAKYREVPYKRVPIGYLVALHEANRTLGRYLRSCLGQARQEKK